MLFRSFLLILLLYFTKLVDSVFALFHLLISDVFLVSSCVIFLSQFYSHSATAATKPKTQVHEDGKLNLFFSDSRFSSWCRVLGWSLAWAHLFEREKYFECEDDDDGGASKKEKSECFKRNDCDAARYQLSVFLRSSSAFYSSRPFRIRWKFTGTFPPFSLWTLDSFLHFHEVSVNMITSCLIEYLSRW